MDILSKFYRFTLVGQSLLLFTFATLLTSSSLAQSVLSPEKIHKKVSPSVALITDIESHGSGVVISEDGLLITNYHVVASGLPLNVTVAVKKGRKIEDMTFKNLKVWKVHPEYDLALIKLPNKGVKFAVANLPITKKSVAAGAACYAIGNPGGMNKALDQSITNGLVSSANREVDGLKYMQVSCALNPGNSGGAICDNKGTVIGIATWKIGQAENIGFAIPTRQIKLNDFIDLKERKPNLELGAKYEQEGHKFEKLSLQLQGKDKELAIRIATVFYRKSLEHLPNSPSPYNNIGLMYYRLKKDKIARIYLEKSLKIKPLFAPSAMMLGVILDRTFKDEKAALDLWFENHKDPENLASASQCMENISIHYFNKKQLNLAAYCIKWANSINPPKGKHQATRTQIWQTSSKNLTEAQFYFLQSKAEHYSKKEMVAFGKGTLAKLKAGKNNEHLPTSKALSGILKINKDSYFKAAKEKLSKAVEIGKEGLTVPLPGKPGKIIMGYAGAYLLIEFPALKRIGVFDICSGKMTKYISLPEGKCRFTAGGQILLIYLPEAKKFQLWDMKTWTMKIEKNFRSTRVIHNLRMGLLNHNFALVTLTKTDRSKNDSIGILTLPDCKLIIPKWTATKKSNPLSSLHFFIGSKSWSNVEESGRYATVCNPGCAMIDFSNTMSPKIEYRFSAPDSSFMLGGNYLITSSNNDLILKSGIESHKCLLGARYKKYNPHSLSEAAYIAPIVGFKGFVNIDQRRGKAGGILVRDLKTLDILSITDLPRKIFNKNHRDTSTKPIFASAYVQRCVFIDKDEKTLSIFPIKLDAQAKARAAEAVKPGSPVSRVINVPKGSKVSIEGDHAGMSFDPKTNTLTWQIPANFKRGTKESIILMITAEDGKVKYHIEKIYVLNLDPPPTHKSHRSFLSSN